MTIRKLGRNKFRLYSHKGSNLGTFKTRAGALRHEKQVNFFRYSSEHGIKLRNQK